MTSLIHWIAVLPLLLPAQTVTPPGQVPPGDNAANTTPKQPAEIQPETPARDEPVLGRPTWTDVPPGLSLNMPDRPLSTLVRARILADKTTVPAGSPVFIEFSIQNLTGEPVTLVVPSALRGKERPDLGMGLPLEHVFSGVSFRGLLAASEGNPNLGDRIVRKPDVPIPAVILAPYASLGLRFDVSRFYPGLHQTGMYRLGWKPYGGALEAEPLTVQVMPFKQAVIETEYGNMTMRLLYDKAPKHIENFITLTNDRFYNNLLFHNIYPNQFILGGDPHGDGTGKRPDGGTLAPEFNDTPFTLGTVAMALIEGDQHSASCQFFICLARQPGWDGKYTAFGQIDGPESLEILKKLGAAETNADHAPVKPIKIKSITIQDAPLLLQQLK